MPDWPALIAIGSVVIAVCVLLDRLTISDRGVIWLRVRYLAEAVAKWKFRRWHRRVAVAGLRLIRWIVGDARSLRETLVTVTSLSVLVTFFAFASGGLRERGQGWFLTSVMALTMVGVPFYIWRGYWRREAALVAICGAGGATLIVMAWIDPAPRPLVRPLSMVAVILVNLLLDSLTIGATWLVLSRVVRCGAIAATLLFVVDVVVALLLAFTCFVLLNVISSWASDVPIWTLGESLAVALDQLRVALTTLRPERNVAALHYSSTTLLPTAFYCTIGVVLSLTKIGASATRWVTVRLAGAVANPEDPSDTQPFTVLALLIGVIVALAKMMHQLAQLTVATSP